MRTRAQAASDALRDKGWCRKAGEILNLSLATDIADSTILLQSGEMKRNPDMDKSAVWAGTGCEAVSPIPGLCFISPSCT